MKFLATYLAVLSLFFICSAPAAAQDDACWHYESGEAEWIGQVMTYGEAMDVVISDHYAFVADGTFGLTVLDVDIGPFLIEHPVIVGRLVLSDQLGPEEVVDQIVIENGYVYLGCSNGSCIYQVDVSTPTRPRLVNRIEMVDRTDNRMRLGRTRVRVSGDYAYIVWAEWGDWTGLFQVMDVSNPELPLIIGLLELEEYGLDLAVKDHCVYLCTIGPGGDYGITTFRSVSVENPETPEIVGSVQLDITFFPNIEIVGDYAYIMGPTIMGGVFQIVDICTPESPQVVYSGRVFCADGVSDGQYFYFAGFYSQAGGGSGVVVCDISDPTAPQWIGELWSPIQDYSDQAGIAIAYDRIFFVDNNNGLLVTPRQCVDVPKLSPEPDPQDLYTDSILIVPNPANPQTSVDFTLTRGEHVIIGVYDLTGGRVRTLVDADFSAGPHAITWTGRDSQGRAMPSGTYIVRLETETTVQARKVMLVR